MSTAPIAARLNHQPTTNQPAKPCALRQQSTHIDGRRYVSNNEEFLHVRLHMDRMIRLHRHTGVDVGLYILQLHGAPEGAPMAPFNHTVRP